MKAAVVRLLGWWKAFLVIVGIMLAMFGWYIDHAEERYWAINFFAPKYVRTLETYERMLNNRSELEPNDDGFAEMVSVLSTELSGPTDLIASIKAKRDTITTIFSDGHIGPTILLEITLRDGRSVTLEHVKDLEPAIRKRFLEDALTRRGELITLVGLVVALITTLPEYIRDAKASVVQR
jgi:hypothetical protein